MPTSSTTPATRNAPAKESLSAGDHAGHDRRHDGGRLLHKLTMPPIVPVPPRGAISDTSEEPTGAEAASPARETEIQTTAQPGSVVNIAPNTASPSSIPPTSTVLRACVSSYPARDQVSTSQPPTSRSEMVANTHGIAA